MIALVMNGLALGLAVAAPIGPTNLAAIRAGLRDGPAAALWLGLGAAAVDFAYIGLVYLGIAPLLLRFPWLTLALYVAGSLVLARIALGAIRAAVQGDAAEGRPESDADRGKPFLLGLSITLFNPTTIVSWLSIGGSFIALHLAGTSALRAWAALLAVFAGSALWWRSLRSPWSHLAGDGQQPFLVLLEIVRPLSPADGSQPKDENRIERLQLRQRKHVVEDVGEFSLHVANACLSVPMARCCDRKQCLAALQAG